MKKVVVSYSGGKDSALALHRAIKNNCEPIQLITNYNIDKNRSWFHGIPQEVLERISTSLRIPIRLIKSTGDSYTMDFEIALYNAKIAGAEACVFGDIDIENHRQWCEDRCRNVGIKALFPLWQEKRKSLVYEFIDEGYIAKITIVKTNTLPSYFLGKILTRHIALEMQKMGADVCGENGEYHTFVSNGPIFNSSIQTLFGKLVVENDYNILPMILK